MICHSTILTLKQEEIHMTQELDTATQPAELVRRCYLRTSEQTSDLHSSVLWHFSEQTSFPFFFFFFRQTTKHVGNLQYSSHESLFYDHFLQALKQPCKWFKWSKQSVFGSHWKFRLLSYTGLENRPKMWIYQRCTSVIKTQNPNESSLKC